MVHVMSEVKRWYIGVYDGNAQARATTCYEFEIIHEGQGQLFVRADDFDAQRLRADTAETERDALRVHLAAGIAYVQRLVNCSKNQDSVATGYLSDILAALNQKSEGESHE